MNPEHDEVRADRADGSGIVARGAVALLRLALVLLTTVALRYAIVRFHSGLVSFEAGVFAMCLLAFAVWIMAMLVGFSVSHASAIVGITLLASVVDGLSNKSADILTVGVYSGIPRWIIHIYDVIDESNLSVLSMIIDLPAIVILGAGSGLLAVLIYGAFLDLFVVPFSGIISHGPTDWLDAASLSNPVPRVHETLCVLALGMVSRLLWAWFLRSRGHRQMHSEDDGTDN